MLIQRFFVFNQNRASSINTEKLDWQHMLDSAIQNVRTVDSLINRINTMLQIIHEIRLKMTCFL